jgi:uncharacterized membrane protein
LLASWGALISYSGMLSWPIFGKTTAAMIKGIGEILIDIYQVAPDHWNCRRYNYIKSGFAFLFGTASDMISKNQNDNRIFLDLNTFLSAVGRYFITLSGDMGERYYKRDFAKIQSNPSDLRSLNAAA